MNDDTTISGWIKKNIYWSYAFVFFLWPIFIVFFAWKYSKWSLEAKITTVISSTLLLISFCCIITLLLLLSTKPVVPPVESQSNAENTKNIEENRESSNSSESSVTIKEEVELIMLENSSYYYNTEVLTDEDKFVVTEIVDGDTIKVKDKNDDSFTLRLIGIDTPETKDPNSAVQCFGNEATTYATEQLLSKNVFLLSDETQDDIDKYGRALRYVITEDGYFYNLNAIYSGFANEYTYQIPYEYQKEFKKAQEEARTKKAGLWGNACECKDRQDEVISNECTACNIKTVKTLNWDCSESVNEVSDTSCSTLCPVVTAPAPVVAPQTNSYVCDCSKTCANLSCSEAQYQLNVCGCGQRDGDNDGVACDSKCQ